MTRFNPYQLMYRTHFDIFAELAFEVLHPRDQLLKNWHIGVVAEQLNRFMAGTINRLIINLPPRSLKSFLTSIAMPAFLIGKKPLLRILILAGTADLANDLRQKAIRLMRSHQYRDVFDGIEFAANDRRLDITGGGSLSFLRYGESIIGKGYDVIIIDDPQSPSQVEDAAKREQAVEYIKNEVVHRLNNKTQGGIVVVQQRLHEEDLSGSLLYGAAWRRLAISAVSGDVEKWPTPRGGFVMRDKGVALCEERESKQTIEKQLDQMGAPAFAAQFLQMPGLGIPRRHGNGMAWHRPPENWDGKEPIPWFMLTHAASLSEPLINIRAAFFGGPPLDYIFTDPNPPQTLEEFEQETLAQQAALVKRAQEDAVRRF